MGKDTQRDAHRANFATLVGPAVLPPARRRSPRGGRRGALSVRVRRGARTRGSRPGRPRPTLVNVRRRTRSRRGAAPSQRARIPATDASSDTSSRGRFRGEAASSFPPCFSGRFAAALACLAAVGRGGARVLLGPALPCRPAGAPLRGVPAAGDVARGRPRRFARPRAVAGARRSRAVLAASALGVFFLWIAGAWRLARGLSEAALLWGLPVAVAALLFAARSVRSGFLARAGLRGYSRGTSADRAWRTSLDAEIAGYEAADDEHFRARASDLRDIRDRVLAVLSSVASEPSLPAGAIVLAEDLTPPPSSRPTGATAAASFLHAAARPATLRCSLARVGFR